ncbi:putative metallopeptidase domain protein [Mycobacterium kansasii]|uniref:Putative metallopeptidase domain protein n=1 Tax=Mycobacterium kansasii TaxID=1768 RepID=A0A1V3WEG1_MYCKA|nr:putative metallopeptidase domain protein [Mycobacterium kansasii]
MTEVRALTADEWRRLRLARMAAVEAMPYFARALFALSPVAAPGLGTFAVDRHWRLYLDPKMLGTDEGWSIPLAGAVLLHEVGHVLRDHGGRAEAVDCPVDRTMWNVAADAEINDDLIAAGVGLPGGVVTPNGIGCEDGHVAEVYYRHLVPPGAPRSGADSDPATGPMTVRMTAMAAGRVPGMPRCPENCPPPPTWAAARGCPPLPPIW